MDYRYFSGRRILTVLALTVLIGGCAAKTAGLRNEPPAPLATVFQAIQDTERIVSVTQIDLMTAQGHYPVRAVLVLQKPSYLRLEMLPVIGTPDLFLTATPDDLRVYIPSHGKFYSGKPSAENLERFLSWALKIEDIVMIFSGAYPPLPGKQVSYESRMEGHLLRVDMKTPSGHSQIIWMEKNGRMSKLVRNGSDGRELYQVCYDDYQTASSLAGSIIIQMADRITSVAVKFIDREIEKATDLSIFKLPVPPDVKTIQLD